MAAEWMLTSCLYFSRNNIDRCSKFQEFWFKMQFKILSIILRIRKNIQKYNKNVVYKSYETYTVEFINLFAQWNSWVYFDSLHCWKGTFWMHVVTDNMQELLTACKLMDITHCRMSLDGLLQFINPVCCLFFPNFFFSITSAQERWYQSLPEHW